VLGFDSLFKIFLYFFMLDKEAWISISKESTKQRIDYILFTWRPLDTRSGHWFGMKVWHSLIIITNLRFGWVCLAWIINYVNLILFSYVTILTIIWNLQFIGSYECKDLNLRFEWLCLAGIINYLNLILFSYVTILTIIWNVSEWLQVIGSYECKDL